MREKTLNPVRPSPALEAEYRRRLDKLIDEMARSVAYWLAAAYRKEEPEVRALTAQDESPANYLRRVVRRLARRWQKQFDELSQFLAEHFATDVSKRSDVALKNALRKGGMSVKFRMTRAMNDVVQATVHENVSLIRSIPQRYFTEIEGAVMRSVSAGRDLGQLNDFLRQQYGVTKRRAALISRDQNNKASANLARARQLELGITEAIWVHSGGGKVPRPSHVKAGRDKVRFNLAEGWYDPHEKKHILPGELINCRCVSRPVVPGFS